MLPKGFLVSGIHCGIAKKKSKKDLAVFYSKLPAKACGMFTANVVKAAPVIVSSEHLRINRSKQRMIVANSGCANACTGSKGIRDAKAVCEAASRLMGLEKNQILVASTGVIGQYLPAEKMSKGLGILLRQTGNTRASELSAVRAIMTTDTREKISSRTFKLGKNKITIWGCVKGAGMIHPDLRKLHPAPHRGGVHATMLSFILTDANISGIALEKALNNAVERSFNCVSVDGDTSTNDTVIILANGSAGNLIIPGTGKEYGIFSGALNGVCTDLAKDIARDGEGATKLVEIEIKNARSAVDAKKAASTIATSPLFKTAMFGNDANWGRIMAALGRSGAAFDPDSVTVKIGETTVAEKGRGIKFSEKKTKKYLKGKEVKVSVDLKAGKEKAVYFTCDFSFDYVKINASYRS